MRKTLQFLTLCLSLGVNTPYAHSAQCGVSPAAKPAIAEIVTFKLAENVTEKEFLAFASTAQTGFLCKTEGFVGRTLSKKPDGTWIDHVEWTSRDAAMAAMEKARNSKEVLPFLQAIDPKSIDFAYWAIAAQAW